MQQLPIDFLKPSNMDKERLIDVAENVTVHVKDCFGVRSLSRHIQLHQFVIKQQVFDVNENFEIASLEKVASVAKFCN